MSTSPPIRVGAPQRLVLPPLALSVEPLPWGMNIKALPVVIRPQPPSLQRLVQDWPEEAGRLLRAGGISFNRPGRPCSVKGAEGRPGAQAPKDLGTGLAFTTEPESTLGLVLNATPVFNKTAATYNGSHCARICDKHPTSVISFHPCSTL